MNLYQSQIIKNMNEVNQIAYTFFIGLWTSGFAVLSRCDAYKLMMDGLNDEKVVMSTNVFYKVLMFLISFVCLFSNLYLWIEFGQMVFSDSGYRYAAVSTMTGIASLLCLFNWMYLVYVYYNQEIFSDETNYLKPTEKKDASVLDNNLYDVHVGLYFINALGFLAFIICPIIYLFVVPNGAHWDDASVFLLVSMIAMGCTSFFVFMGTSAKDDKRTIDLLEDAALKPGENFPSNFRVHETITATGLKLFQHGVKLNDTSLLTKLNNSKEEKGYVLGANGENIKRNTTLGILLSHAREKMNDSTTPLAIRKLNGTFYALPSSKALEADHNFIANLNYSVEIPKTFPVGKRSLKVDPNYLNSELTKKSTLVGDRLLDPKKLPKQSNDSKMPYVSIIRNYDEIGTGYFAFTEDVYGLTTGIGLHCNLSYTLVIPFVLFWYPFYIYFLTDTMYGSIAWLITVFLPFAWSFNGTFSHFWDIFLNHFMIGWGAIAMTKLVVPDGDFTYIYSESVWDNIDTAGGVCITTCTSWDECTIYYYTSLISLIFSLAMLCVEAVFTIRKKYDWDWLQPTTNKEL